MVKINLLPLKVRKTKVAIQLYTYLVIAGSAAGILLIILLLNLMTQLRRAEIQIRKAETVRGELAAKAGPLLGLDRQEAELRRTFKLLQPLSRSRSEWIHLLDELADRIQPDLWLTKLASSRPSGKTALQLNLEGEAYQKMVVADFIQSLEQSRRFRNVNLESLVESGSPESRGVVQFKLRADFGEDDASPVAQTPASSPGASGPDGEEGKP